MESFITTRSGRRFNFREPRPADICIRDIARALSRIPRWNGHTKEFYSVAEHSLVVSWNVGERQSSMAMAGLLHDASEAYMGDMTRPLKHLLPESEYKTIEAKVMAAIWERFQIPTDCDPKDQAGIIKHVDHWVLLAEAYYLMPEGTPEAAAFNKVEHGKFFGFACFDPRRAYELFLGEFWKLKCRQLAARATKASAVCICGSSQFIDQMAMLAWEEEKRGRLAMGPNLLPHCYGAQPHHQAETEGVAKILDGVHLNKIDSADEVLICNCDGYIGDRTRVELEYAKACNKPVIFLEA